MQETEDRAVEAFEFILRRYCEGNATVDHVDEARDALFATIATLRAEVEGLRADAERYRYIRNRPQSLCFMNTAQALGLDLRNVYVQRPEQLDAAIDAAKADKEGA